MEYDSFPIHRHGASGRTRPAPAPGAAVPRARAKPVSGTGTSIARPGNVVPSVKTKAVMATVATPVQPRATPSPRGRRRSSGVIVAGNAPVASSNARVKGEKEAVVPSDRVW